MHCSPFSILFLLLSHLHTSFYQRKAGEAEEEEEENRKGAEGVDYTNTLNRRCWV